MPRLTEPWYGPCERCGTSHDGLAPDNLAGGTRCVAQQAARLSRHAPELVALADQVFEESEQRRREAVREKVALEIARGEHDPDDGTTDWTNQGADSDE